MNKEYTYIDGKVIVEDTEGNKRLVEYSDNLDEILVQENVIETLENKIGKLEKEISSYKKTNKQRYIPIVFPSTALITSIGIPILSNLFLQQTNVFVSQVDTIFGTMNEAVLLSSIFSTFLLPLAALIELRLYKEHHHFIKKEKGVTAEFEYLKKQIVVEKEKLIQMKMNNTKDKENTEFRTVNVNDLKKIQAFISWLNLYYDLGYNGDKYYAYYQKYGYLPKKIQNNYTELGQEIIKDYLQENGSTLVKTRKRKK